MNTDDFIIIVQARTGSSRLPNKIIKPFHNNKCILDIIVDKLKQNKFNIPVVVATTKNKNDNVLVNHKYNVFRGDENNVLQRFIDCAEHYEKKIVIRVCSDNPFISLKYFEKLVENYNNQDYYSYFIGDCPAIKTHCGLFCEIVKLSALQYIQELTNKQKYFEHVTNYLYTHPEKFCVQFAETIYNHKLLRDIRLTIDTQNDFDLVKQVYEDYHKLHDSDTEDLTILLESLTKETLNKMHFAIIKNSK